MLAHVVAGRHQAFKVLDAACGNGRFGVYLAERSPVPVLYEGIDQSGELLKIARERLPHARFIEGDLIEETVSGEFDLVAAMGIMHHVPSHERRVSLMRKLAACVARDGFLAVSFWSFDLSKTVSFQEVGIDPADVEADDHLLRFADKGFRYCHHTSDAERELLIQSTGLRKVDEWSDDEQNTYALLVG